MAQAPLVHLFDGHVYIFRAYFSMPPRQAPDGAHTGAAYGFANTLVKYLREERPTHGAVCFDAALVSFRNRRWPEYKAGRTEPPPDLEPQFELCMQAADVLGFPPFSVADFEADDLLGTLVTRLHAAGARVRIITTDKDLAQLVSDDGRVLLFDLAKGRELDAEGVRARFGVWPHQIPDYLALVGDSVDNLPGVPGIGPKSAAAILERFESLEAVPTDAREWEGLAVRGAARMAERFAAAREQAFLVRELASVRRDVPGLPGDVDAFELATPLESRVEPLFDRLGWQAITRRVLDQA